VVEHHVGLFSFQGGTIMSAIYLDILQNFVFPWLAEVDGLIFQQDGEPHHFGDILCTALDVQFPGHWIRRGGLINWPKQSPDLTPIKDFVYSERVESLPDLH
jgi:hypothetical protein